MIRKGIKTTEFWVGAISVLLMSVLKYLFPNAPFPEEQFTAVMAWIIARFGQKAIADDGSRSWKTSEFWVVSVFSLVKYIVPSMPEEVFQLVMAWVIGRPVMKVAAAKLQPTKTE